MADMFDKEELSIVGSLFGASPEVMQIAREKAAFTQGTQAGQNLLGGILGNVGMFAERGAAGLRSGLNAPSPEERIVNLRQQATQQFDTNTPEGLYQMAQFLNQQGDAAGARQAIMVAQGQQQRMATLGKTVAETQKALTEKIPPPQTRAEEAKLTQLLAKYPDTVEGRAAAANEFAEWKSSFRQKEAAAGVAPGEAKIPDLRTAQLTVKDYIGKSQESLSTIKTIKNYGEMIKAGNSSQLPQFQRALVKLVGDSQIGQNELKNILGSAGIAADIIDGFTKFLTGKPTNVKIDDILKGVSVLEQQVQESYRSGQEQARRVLTNSQFNPKIVDDLVGPPLKITPPSAGGAKTAPPVGTIMNGYKFNGGNPADQKSWSKVTTPE